MNKEDKIVTYLMVYAPKGKNVTLVILALQGLTFSKCFLQDASIYVLIGDNAETYRSVKLPSENVESVTYDDLHNLMYRWGFDLSEYKKLFSWDNLSYSTERQIRFDNTFQSEMFSNFLKTHNNFSGLHVTVALPSFDSEPSWDI